VSKGRDRAWLLAHLPHQGAMNLLQAVDDWDEANVCARASSHRDPGNPLRREGVLPVTAAIEYGAQAAAAHGALVGTSGAGVLASMRRVRFHAERLDDVGGDLEVRAQQVGGGESGVLYDFRVACDGRLLAEGRVTVAFTR
jgi:predicted hotdog family 3-hydroxylacyl-ACP dehydratase